LKKGGRFGRLFLLTCHAATLNLKSYMSIKQANRVNVQASEKVYGRPIVDILGVKS
jgi:hypothetical protein